ncbi:WGR domain-containing protein [Bradyrhizobium sp. 141]|uniref:WGR domain-containing protein n=1 Tax=Bradyrhizobium sp. 141 TaxID=2782617 RepID=UPI00320B576A
MSRFYVLMIEPALFGDTALLREWGRLGKRGRRRLDVSAGPGAGPPRRSRLGSCVKPVVGYFRRSPTAAVSGSVHRNSKVASKAEAYANQVMRGRSGLRFKLLMDNLLLEGS